MNKTEDFEQFWMTIDLNEEFLKTYGQHECFDYEERSHSDLMDANREVQKHLKTVSLLRMFDGPGENERFSAQNYHEALISVLNPPERWFRQLWVLNSPEYLALKSGARNEEDSVLSGDNKTNTDPKTKTTSRKKPSFTTSKDAFNVSKKLVLEFLLGFHGCNSGNPHNSYLSQSQIMEKIQDAGIDISQPTVSRAMDSLMSLVPLYSGLDGAKKYKQLCNQSEICDALSSLQVKSNQYLDRGLHEKYERSDEYIELHSEKGH